MKQLASPRRMNMLRVGERENGSHPLTRRFTHSPIHPFTHSSSWEVQHNG